ncbi:MAG: 2TM domain-containing protein [Leptolyngbyaceae cyanobacterium bins.59]|nr:2TM domain-containing protein [Leptolyngbyaceae cyanobacterium bins.59]
MPPRWPRQPDRNDPAYRRLDDRMNFAVHVAVFAACNSGLWFFRTLATAPLANPIMASATWITLSWFVGLFLHGVYVFKLANYSSLPPMEDVPSKSTEG